MSVTLGSVTSNGVVVPTVMGDKLAIFSAIKFSGTYKTGGDITLSEEIEKVFKEIGRGTIDWVEVNGSLAFAFEYNYATSKMQVVVGSTGLENAEEAYPAGITGATLRLFALGR